MTESPNLSSEMTVTKSQSSMVTVTKRYVHGHASIQESGYIIGKELEIEHKQLIATVESSSDYAAYFAKMNASSIEMIWSDVAKLLVKDATTSYTGHGNFVAVMGPRESGKTTFLNLLAARLEEHYAGRKYDQSNFKAIKWEAVSGCVVFDTKLDGSLTIDQMLQSAVALIRGINLKQQRERLREVMQKMGLFDHRLKLVSQITEGVRRRLIVALELLEHPRLLLLDEPTAGLDAEEAFSFHLALKALTESGLCTVVCTVRRVEIDVFDLFDHLIVLKCSRVVYYGLAVDASVFFEECGFLLSAGMEISDYILLIVSGKWIHEVAVSEVGQTSTSLLVVSGGDQQSLPVSSVNASKRVSHSSSTIVTTTSTTTTTEQTVASSSDMQELIGSSSSKHVTQSMKEGATYAARSGAKTIETLSVTGTKSASVNAEGTQASAATKKSNAAIAESSAVRKAEKVTSTKDVSVSFGSSNSTSVSTKTSDVKKIQESASIVETSIDRDLSLVTSTTNAIEGVDASSAVVAVKAYDEKSISSAASSVAKAETGVKVTSVSAEGEEKSASIGSTHVSRTGNVSVSVQSDSGKGSFAEGKLASKKVDANANMKAVSVSAEKKTSSSFKGKSSEFAKSASMELSAAAAANGSVSVSKKVDLGAEIKAASVSTGTEKMMVRQSSTSAQSETSTNVTSMSMNVDRESSMSLHKGGTKASTKNAKDSSIKKAAGVSVDKETKASSIVGQAGVTQTKQVESSSKSVSKKGTAASKLITTGTNVVTASAQKVETEMKAGSVGAVHEKSSSSSVGSVAVTKETDMKVSQRSTSAAADCKSVSEVESSSTSVVQYAEKSVSVGGQRGRVTKSSSKKALNAVDATNVSVSTTSLGGSSSNSASLSASESENEDGTEGGTIVNTVVGIAKGAYGWLYPGQPDQTLMVVKNGKEVEDTNRSVSDDIEQQVSEKRISRSESSSSSSISQKNVVSVSGEREALHSAGSSTSKSDRKVAIIGSRNDQDDTTDTEVKFLASSFNIGQGEAMVGNAFSEVSKNGEADGNIKIAPATLVRESEGPSATLKDSESVASAQLYVPEVDKESDGWVKVGKTGKKGSNQVASGVKITSVDANVSTSLVKDVASGKIESVVNVTKAANDHDSMKSAQKRKTGSSPNSVFVDMVREETLVNAARSKKSDTEVTSSSVSVEKGKAHVPTVDVTISKNSVKVATVSLEDWTKDTFESTAKPVNVEPAASLSSMDENYSEAAIAQSSREINPSVKVVSADMERESSSTKITKNRRAGMQANPINADIQKQSSFSKVTGTSEIETNRVSVDVDRAQNVTSETAKLSTNSCSSVQVKGVSSGGKDKKTAAMISGSSLSKKDTSAKAVSVKAASEKPLAVAAGNTASIEVNKSEVQKKVVSVDGGKEKMISIQAGKVSNASIKTEAEPKTESPILIDPKTNGTQTVIAHKMTEFLSINAAKSGPPESMKVERPESIQTVSSQKTSQPETVVTTVSVDVEREKKVAVETEKTARPEAEAKAVSVDVMSKSVSLKKASNPNASANSTPAETRDAISLAASAANNAKPMNSAVRAVASRTERDQSGKTTTAKTNVGVTSASAPVKAAEHEKSVESVRPADTLKNTTAELKTPFIDVARKNNSNAKSTQLDVNTTEVNVERLNSRTVSVTNSGDVEKARIVPVERTEVAKVDTGAKALSSDNTRAALVVLGETETKKSADFKAGSLRLESITATIKQDSAKSDSSASVVSASTSDMKLQKIEVSKSSENKASVSSVPVSVAAEKSMEFNRVKTESSAKPNADVKATSISVSNGKSVPTSKSSTDVMVSREKATSIQAEFADANTDNSVVVASDKLDSAIRSTPAVLSATNLAHEIKTLKAEKNDAISTIRSANQKGDSLDNGKNFTVSVKAGSVDIAKKVSVAGDIDKPENMSAPIAAISASVDRDLRARASSSTSSSSSDSEANAGNGVATVVGAISAVSAAASIRRNSQRSTASNGSRGSSFMVKRDVVSSSSESESEEEALSKIVVGAAGMVKSAMVRKSSSRSVSSVASSSSSATSGSRPRRYSNSSGSESEMNESNDEIPSKATAGVVNVAGATVRRQTSVSSISSASSGSSAGSRNTNSSLSSLPNNGNTISAGSVVAGGVGAAAMIPGTSKPLPVLDMKPNDAPVPSFKQIAAGAVFGAQVGNARVPAVDNSAVITPVQAEMELNRTGSVHLPRSSSLRGKRSVNVVEPTPVMLARTSSIKRATLDNEDNSKFDKLAPVMGAAALAAGVVGGYATDIQVFSVTEPQPLMQDVWQSQDGEVDRAVGGLGMAAISKKSRGHRRTDSGIELQEMTPGGSPESFMALNRTSTIKSGATRSSTLRSERSFSSISRADTERSFGNVYFDQNDTVDVGTDSGRAIDPESPFDNELTRPTNLLAQFKVIFLRSWKDQVRSKWFILLMIFERLFTALAIGLTFYGLGLNQDSIAQRQSVLFFCVASQALFGAVLTVTSFAIDRKSALIGHSVGGYNSAVYFGASLAIELLFHVFFALIFSLASYLLIDLQYYASKFFIFYAFMILTSVVAGSITFLVASIVRSTDFVLAVFPFLVTIPVLFGLYFITPVPSYFDWLATISFVRYSYMAVSINEFSGLRFTCQPSELIRNGTTCPITSGVQVLRDSYFTTFTMWWCALVLIIIFAVLRLTAFLSSRYIKCRK